MSIAREIFSRHYNQAKRLLKYKVAEFPSLGSMTLEKDDYFLAKDILRKTSEWFDPESEQDYEKQFSEWHDSRYAYSFMSARESLSACIEALRLSEKDEVILPAYTCVVVPNSFKFKKIHPVYADIELDTYGIDIQSLKKVATKSTKAILLHHLYGLVCRDYEQIIDFAKENKIKVIEDCAQSTGCRYKDMHIGHLGDIAFFSSEQSKAFNSMIGGVATTSDDELGHRLGAVKSTMNYPSRDRVLKALETHLFNYEVNHFRHRWLTGSYSLLKYRRHIMISTTDKEISGQKPSYYGCKMPAALTKLAQNQLNKIDFFNKRRVRTAKKWELWCDSHNYKKPLITKGSKPIYLRYPILVSKFTKQNRSFFHKTFKIDPGVWFVSNLHPSNTYMKQYLNAYKAVKLCINLPTILPYQYDKIIEANI